MSGRKTRKPPTSDVRKIHPSEPACLSCGPPFGLSRTDCNTVKESQRSEPQKKYRSNLMRRNWGGNKQLLKKTNHLRIFEFGPVHNCANLVDREHRFISERPISRYDRRRARRDMASEICRDATPPKVITYALFTCVTGGPIVAAIGVDWILSSRDIGGRSFVRHSLYIPTEKEGPDCGYVFHSEQARTITIPTSS